MGSRRSLRFLLFAFDALRLVAVVSVLSALRALFSSPGGGSFGAPAVAFAAPQALFPLMALFSWLDPVRFVPYPPLYAAGKAVSVASLAAWLIDSAEDALMAVGLGNTGAVMLAAGTALVLLYDAVSAILALYLVRVDARAAHTDSREGPDTAARSAAAARSAPAVETVPDTLAAAADSADSPGGA